MGKYDSGGPGQLDRLMAKIKDFNPQNKKEKRKSIHVRVDEESLKQIKFLSKHLFEVSTTYSRVIEETLSFLWRSMPELWNKYKEQEKKND